MNKRIVIALSICFQLFTCVQASWKGPDYQDDENTPFSQYKVSMRSGQSRACSSQNAQQEEVDIIPASRPMSPINSNNGAVQASNWRDTFNPEECRGYFVLLPTGESRYFENLTEYHNFYVQAHDRAGREPCKPIECYDGDNPVTMTQAEFAYNMPSHDQVYLSKYQSQFWVDWFGAQEVARREEDEFSRLS